MEGQAQGVSDEFHSPSGSARSRALSAGSLGPPAARTSSEWRGLPTRHRPAGSQLTRDSRCLVASKSRRLLFGTRRPAVPSCAQRVPPSAVPTARGAPQGA